MRFKRFPAVIGLLFLLVASGARAEFPGKQPWPGVTYGFEERKNPAMRIHWVEVDLGDPKIEVKVRPGGADPDGDGPFQTTLMRPTEVAERDKLDLAVNGDFFSVKNEGGLPVYRPGQWASATGPAASDGKAWSSPNRKRPCLVIRKDGSARIELVARPGEELREVVSGNVMLVEKGKAVASENMARHPRTAVGVDEKGKRLVILVVDGRRPGESEGMSYAELSRELIRLGCHIALNLDGGGSTVMVMRDRNESKLKIINRPSDGRERAVVNVLGVRVRQ